MTTTEAASIFQCPGEQQPISESVHLARLAAYYPACRDCIHRNNTGQIAPKIVERIKEAEHRIPRGSLLTDEGVRGIYLNEMTRLTAGNYAGALAALLWKKIPQISRGDLGKPAQHPGPTVVTGHDERPSSPDVAVGVVRALRTMSCRVIDVGQITRPGFWFAVDHMQAAAGVHVSGSGCAPVWTGFDFVTAPATPISAGKLLTEIETRAQDVISRPSRQAGQLRAFHAAIPYEASLWKHFHALRPLKLVCSSASLMVRDLLTRIFETLPCELLLIETPCRERDITNSQDVDMIRLSRTVQRQHADLGILIDDDAQRCGFVDERGSLVSSRQVTRMLADFMQVQHPEHPIAIESPAAEAFPAAINAGETMAAMSATIREHQAAFGGGDSGRYWFRESFPTCDAVLTVARALQALSRSDAEFSRVVVEG